MILQIVLQPYYTYMNFVAYSIEIKIIYKVKNVQYLYKSVVNHLNAY